MTASNPTTGTKENKPRMRLAVASPLLRRGSSALAAGPIAALGFCADSVEAGLPGESERPQKRQKASVSATSLPQLGQNMSHLPSPRTHEADGLLSITLKVFVLLRFLRIYECFPALELATEHHKTFIETKCTCFNNENCYTVNRLLFEIPIG